MNILNVIKNAGSPDEFIRMIDDKWNIFVIGCMGQTSCRHIVLQKGEFLKDRIESIIPLDK